MYDIDLIKKSVLGGKKRRGGGRSCIQAPVVKFGNKNVINVSYNVLYVFGRYNKLPKLKINTLHEELCRFDGTCRI